jgi:hypothetical protein
MVAVAAIVTVAAVATIATTMAAMATLTVAAATMATMAATIAVSSTAVTAIAVSGTTITAVAATTCLSLLLGAGQAIANDREKQRDSKKQSAIHPRILQAKGT